MNDVVDIESEVDAWARTATSALRRAAAMQTIPPPPLRRGIVWKRPLLALATVAFMIVGVAAIVRRGTDSPRADGGPNGHWIITDLPEGMKPNSYTDANTARSSTTPELVSNQLYATAAAPFGQIVGFQWASPKSATAINPATNRRAINLEPAPISTRSAVFADGPAGSRLLFVKVGEVWVLMSSIEVADPTLVEIAKGLDLDANLRLLLSPGLLPPTLKLQPADLLQVIAPDYAGDTMSRTYAVTPELAPDSSQFIQLITTKNTDWLSLMGPPMRVEVDGSEAFYYRTESQWNENFLTWRRDDVQFVLHGYGNTSEAELIAAAASTRLASDDEWNNIAWTAERTSQTVGTEVVSADDAQAPNIGGPSGTNPTTIRVIVDPRDVAANVNATVFSSVQTEFSGTFKDGGNWSIATRNVAGSVSWIPTFKGDDNQGLQLWYLAAVTGSRLVADPATDNYDSAYAVTFKPEATTLRVTLYSGDRYSIPLVDTGDSRSLKLAAMMVPNGDLRLAEVLDAYGKVLDTSP